jgi:WD40 repeat protein
LNKDQVRSVDMLATMTDYEVQLWRFDATADTIPMVCSFSLENRIDGSRDQYVQFCDFNFDGTKVAILLSQANEILIVDVNNGRVTSFDGQGKRVERLSMCKVSNKMASTASDGTTMVWDLDATSDSWGLTPPLLQVLQSPAAFTSFTPAGSDDILIRGDQHEVSVWSWRSNRAVVKFKTESNRKLWNNYGIKRVCASYDNRKIAVGRDDVLMIYDLQSAAKLLEVENVEDCDSPVCIPGIPDDDYEMQIENDLGELNWLEFNRDGSLLLATHEYRVQLWDCATGTMVFFVGLIDSAFDESFNRTCFLDDGKTIIAGGFDGNRLKLFDQETAINGNAKKAFEVDLSNSNINRNFAGGLGSLALSRSWESMNGRDEYFAIVRFGALGGFPPPPTSTTIISDVVVLA